MKQILFAAFLTCTTFIATAQLTIPKPSPASTVSQKVGLAEVSVTYSRPSAKGRKVMGDVVPFGKPWRTGANEATKISFTDTVTIEGNKINPGEYALYTIPAETEWTIILGKDAKAPVQNYKTGEEVALFKVKSVKITDKVETFTIGFDNVTPASAEISLVWENTKVSFKVSNDYDAKVMAEINQKMDNGLVYFQAASYYLETNRDMKKALEWINIATKNDPKFYQLYVKAKIQVQLGDCKGAIETATKSIELAKEAKNDEYVKMNEKLINDCKKKK